MKGILWDGKRVRRAVTFATPVNKKGFVRKFQILLNTLDPRGLVKKIGIGAAGVIEGAKVKSATNIPYLKDFDFRKAVADNRLIKVDNDARSFARAEYALGVARGARSAFFVTIGTGIGRALGRRGKILKIKRFESAEPWEKDYQKLRRKDPSTLATFLAQHLASLIRKFEPEVMVLGGGGITSGAVKIDKIRWTARKYLSPLFRKTPIIRGKFGEAAGAIGAALMFKKGLTAHFRRV